MSFSVICISATDGADAAQVATALGEALGFPVIDEEIVVRAAAEAGLDKQAIVNVEQRKTMLTKLLGGVMLGAGATELDFVRSTDDQIRASTIGVRLERRHASRPLAATRTAARSVSTATRSRIPATPGQTRRR